MDKATAVVLFPGDSEMALRMRDFDWSQTSIGPLESWSPALWMMVRVLLANRFPLLLWWGPRYIQIYNDPYCPVLGTKHPSLALGRPVSECWAEIWQVLKPLIDTPYYGGPATWMDDLFVEVNRHGFVEETHFTIAYSPVPDETAPRGIGGVLATVHEITDKVIGERRMSALRDLGSRSTSAKTAEDACAFAAKVLANHAKDVPFALLYLLDAGGKRARLADAVGIGIGEPISPVAIDLGASNAGGWPLAEAMQTEALQVVAPLGARFASVPPGPWSDPPHTAVVVPLPSNKAHELAGFLVAGVSSRLAFNDSYRVFLELATAQIAAGIANARAYEEERHRAETLAELDRAKTLFFTNISHEFRTPLTLMLGPVEEMLAEPNGDGLPADRQRLQVVYRHSLRLLKLVNTPLDFSRIEAGRMQAVYERTDIAALTCELASMFRSATEKAGMRLILDCPTIDAPVYLDRAMWEKIVLNLLSNAFKFTFEGEIAVSLRQVGEVVELSVRDTGVGIPPKDLPHVFERFHRVEEAKRRSYEGTGIGLALVYELTKLHGGSVRVQSAEGQGTSFVVSMPTGSEHLPPDRIDATRTVSSTSLAPALYVDEAQRWLPDGVASSEWREASEESLLATRHSPLATPCRPRIVLADDNADMRDYVRRLLCQRFDVEAVADGAAALESARRRPPDLVLSDVMMPRLDGFGLLRELRADPTTRTIPIILLSARAGEEARVEGLGNGADDYLIKPFSARELLARVDSHLALARRQRETEERITTILESITDGFFTLDHDWRFVYVNAEAERLNGMSRHDMLGKSQWELFPDTLGTIVETEFRRAVAEQICLNFESFYQPWGRWFAIRAYPVKNGGLSVYFHDITQRKQIEEAVQQSTEALKEADQRKDEFLATLAHELRNPLAPIRNSVQIMRLARGNREITEQARQTIERQLAQLVRLVDDLLDVSRITRNKIELRKERVALSSIVHSAIETSRPIIEASGHELTVTVAPQTVWLHADLIRMAQVVSNLLNNAAKYTSERGRIWLTAEPQEDSAVIRVRDSGIGIPPEMLPHIFDMFTQVDSSRDRAQGGLGIGLTLVKSLVEMHGGSVNAASAGPDRGSEFTVRLPIAAAEQTSRGAGKPGEGEVGKRLPSRRILVVDDNRESAESLGMLLELMGNQVRIAHGGRAALEQAAAFRPDLALLDIGMPGMSGYELARRIRELPDSGGIILAAVTGWGQEEDRLRSQEAGFDHHLTKPADLASLEKLLASLHSATG